MPGTLTGDPNASFDATLDNINSNGTTPASPTEMNSRYQKLLDNLAVLKKLTDDLESSVSSEISDLEDQLNNLGIGDIGGLQAALDGKAAQSDFVALQDAFWAGDVFTLSKRQRITGLNVAPGVAVPSSEHLGTPYAMEVASGKQLRLKRVLFRASSFDGNGVDDPNPRLRMQITTGSGPVFTYYLGGGSTEAFMDEPDQLMLTGPTPMRIIAAGPQNHPDADGPLTAINFMYQITMALVDA